MDIEATAAPTTGQVDGSPASAMQVADQEMIAAAKSALADAKQANDDGAPANDDAAPANETAAEKPVSAADRMRALLERRETGPAKERVETRSYEREIAELKSKIDALQKPPPKGEDPFELFRQNPSEFFKRAGMTPEEAQLVQLKAGSPEMEMYRRALLAEQKAEQYRAELAKQIEELRNERDTEKQQTHAGYVERTEKAFIETAKAKGGVMGVLAAQNPDLALEMGHSLVRQIRKKDESATCTDDDILEYFNSILSAPGVGAPQKTTAEVASQTSAKVPRNLTGQRASERRATPQMTQHASEEDARKAMMQAARDALRSK